MTTTNLDTLYLLDNHDEIEARGRQAARTFFTERSPAFMSNRDLFEAAYIMGLSAGLVEPRLGEQQPWQYAIVNPDTEEILDTFKDEDKAKISLQVLADHGIEPYTDCVLVKLYTQPK